MASLLSILKNIISLNRVHAEKQESFYGGTDQDGMGDHDEGRLYTVFYLAGQGSAHPGICPS